MNRKLESMTHTLPAYWASYLINGDASGLEDDDIACCDRYTAKFPGHNFCSCEGEQYFSHRNDAGTLAGDVLEFTSLYSVPAHETGNPAIADNQRLLSATLKGKPLKVYDDGEGKIFAVWDNCGMWCYPLGLIRAHSWEAAYEIAEDEMFPGTDETHEDFVKEYGEDYPENSAWCEQYGFRPNGGDVYTKSLDIRNPLTVLTAKECAEHEIVLTIESE